MGNIAATLVNFTRDSDNRKVHIAIRLDMKQRGLALVDFLPLLVPSQEMANPTYVLDSQGYLLFSYDYLPGGEYSQLDFILNSSFVNPLSFPTAFVVTF